MSQNIVLASFQIRVEGGSGALLGTQLPSDGVMTKVPILTSDQIHAGN